MLWRERVAPPDASFVWWGTALLMPGTCIMPLGWGQEGYVSARVACSGQQAVGGVGCAVCMHLFIRGSLA